MLGSAMDNNGGMLLIAQQSARVNLKPIKARNAYYCLVGPKKEGKKQTSGRASSYQHEYTTGYW